jgi:DNA polymerase III delta subunit
MAENQKPKSATKTSTSTAALSILDSKNPPHILLVESFEFCLAERFLKKFISKFFSDKADSIIKFDGRNFADTSLKEFAQASSSLSLFSDEKLIVISHIDQVSASMLAKLILYIENSSNQNSFFIWGKALQERSIFRKKIDSIGKIITFNQLTNIELKRFIVKEFDNYGIKNITEEVVELLIRISDESLSKVINSVNLVAMYSDNNKVTVEDVKNVLIPTTTIDIFQYVESMISGQSNKCTVNSNKIIADSSSIFGILSITSKNIFNLSAYYSCLKDGSVRRDPSYLKNVFGLSPWLINKLTTLSKATNEMKISNLARSTLKADLSVKGKSVSHQDIIQGVIDS